MVWAIYLLVLVNYVAQAWRTSSRTVLIPQRTVRRQTYISALGDGQTVYGLSSGIPDGGCGVAVTRISGRQSLKVLELLTQHKGESRSEKLFKCLPRVATLRNLYDVSHTTPIDKVITIYFPAPNSFTGEDVVEIHTHGSRAIIAQLFESMREISKTYNLELRQAERGEFTRRAFYNGKMDLTQAEAVRDLIASETTLEMENAALKIHGGLSQIYRTWADRLNTLLAHLEAKIEFEEQASTDIPTTVEEVDTVAQHLRQIATEIENKVNDTRGELLSMGATVAIVGAPNAGKSSLINAICNRKVAIVADMPGTTRDLVQARYDLNGVKVTFVDTAGIRSIEANAKDNSQDGVEMQGIEMALQYINDAKMVLFLFDHTNVELSERALDLTLKRIAKHSQLFICISKADLLNEEQMLLFIQKLRTLHRQKAIQVMAISSRKPETLDAMLHIVHHQFTKDYLDVRKQPFITEARHRTHLMNVLREIRFTLQAIESGRHDLEIIAQHLVQALPEISYIVGDQTNEQMLDAIFRTFCVGK
ncbi:putative tRNA modification GTPase [Babesia sp. Xinjiang]|uniref:putative tRNA modification GTPase n=1 Tax=Babesia sp. Xinjiang TaxID=462227 RepID=UPI000A22793B|nr:putative tRNA modification GTPase [Babesia sp. Xinjiang]ORM42081.1 putative tRNA modification GTPase [Babesia sp. Xinjiang]